MKTVLASLLCFCTTAGAVTPLERAIPLLPILKEETATYFPEIPYVSVLAGQIEAESLWKVDAQLKTARERGTGLSQATIAYNADGSIRFDTISELKRSHKAELAAWTEATLFDPRLNMRALVLKDRGIFLRVNGAADVIDRIAFMAAGYNCGEGMVRKDRLLCGNTPNCNPAKWFGHTEKQGYQSKTKWQGYGNSAFDITRHYVRSIMTERRHKYVPYTVT